MHSGRVGKSCSSVDEGVKTRRGEEEDKVAVGAKDIKRYLNTTSSLHTVYRVDFLTKEVEEELSHWYGPIEWESHL